MRIEYDPKADAACINLVEHLGQGDVPRTHLCDCEMKESAIILGFGRDGRLVQLEILGASKILPPSLLEDHPISG